MLFQSKKQHRLVLGVTIGVLLCIVSGIALTSKYLSVASPYDKHYPSEKSPVRILSIEIHENQREELFDQLRNVSERNNLEFHLSFYENEKVFFVEMYGKGLEILALSKPINATELDILFFEKDPADPLSQETVDVLYEDIRSSIGEISNVNIRDKK